MDLQFNDYYDIVVWDNEPGEMYANVYNVICEVSRVSLKLGRRFCSGMEAPLSHALASWAQIPWRHKSMSTSECLVFIEINTRNHDFGKMQKNSERMQLSIHVPGPSRMIVRS